MFPHDGNCFSDIRGCSGGKFDAERTSFPFLAGDKNRGAVGGADSLYDREPQPSATGSTRARLIRAIKTLENMRQSVGRNSCAIVGDFDNGSPVFYIKSNMNGPAFLGVLDGVVDEVQHDLLEMGAIAFEVNALFHGDREGNRLVLRQNFHLSRGAGNQLAEIDVKLVELDLSRIQARYGEQAFYNSRHPVRLFQGATDVSFKGLIERIVVHNAFQLQLQDGQRRAQFVRSIGGEAVDVLEGVIQAFDHSVERR